MLADIPSLGLIFLEHRHIIGILHVAVVQRVLHPPSLVIGREPALDGRADEGPSGDEGRRHHQADGGEAVVETVGEVAVRLRGHRREEILDDVHALRS